MKSKTIRLAAGACVVLAAAAVYLAVSYLEPAVYFAGIFAMLLFAILTSTYIIVAKTAQASRRQIKANAALHKVTHLRLQNLEASRARAAVKMQKTISHTAAGILKTDASISDSEAARARAARKTNEQVNAVLSELKYLGAAAESLERLGTASRDLLLERAKSRSQVVESFTKHAVQVEMYLTEIQESLADPAPSYKDEVLGKLLHRAG